MSIRPRNKSHKSPYSYPQFPPHITLASFPSGFSTDDVRRCLPSQLPSPFYVFYDGVECGDHYFRSVYITINLSDTLAHIHSSIHQSASIQENTPLFPHLSLSYIDESDAENGERESYYNELERQSKIGQLLATRGFTAKEIWIANCDGPVENWRILDKIPL